MLEREAIIDKVQGILRDIFGDEADLHLDASIIDELGAESIDFIDIAYQLEDAFGISAPQDEVFRGTLDLAGRGYLQDGRVTDEGMAEIRASMPGFDLSRFPGGIIREGDVSRLVTVGTIVGFVERRLGQAATAR